MLRIRESDARHDVPTLCVHIVIADFERESLWESSAELFATSTNSSLFFSLTVVSLRCRVTNTTPQPLDLTMSECMV